MKLLITGATGLIGKNLITHAKRRKISIHFLTTRKEECINSEASKAFFGILNKMRLMIVASKE